MSGLLSISTSRHPATHSLFQTFSSLTFISLFVYRIFNMYSLYLLSLLLPALTLACQGKAIYILSNQAKNSVVALSIQKDGTLVQKSVTATGGAGAAGIDSSTNGPSGPDALFSQSALTVAGKVRQNLQTPQTPKLTPLTSTSSLSTPAPTP